MITSKRQYYFKFPDGRCQEQEFTEQEFKLYLTQFKASEITKDEYINWLRSDDHMLERLEDLADEELQFDQPTE